MASIETPEIWDIARFDGLMFTLFAIAALTTVLRLLTRGFFLHTIGADDILAVVATLTGAALSGFEHQKNLNNNRYLQAIRDGEPIESGPIVLNHLTEVERMTLLNGLAYVITLCFIKCAILTFYRRIVVLKQHIYMINTTEIFIVAFTIGFVVAKCLAHDPPASVWNPYDPKYGGKTKCLCSLLAVINSCFQTVFDIMILIIPFFIFRTLKLNHSLKVGIVFVYILGLFSFTTTLIRLSWAIRYLNMKDFVLKHEKLIEFSAWTVVETYMALICANLPPMTTLLRRTFNKITLSIGLSTGSGSGSTSTTEKRGGSKNNSGNKRKRYFQSLRYKSSSSDAQLARKAAPFGFGGPQIPSPTTDSSAVYSPTVTSTIATGEPLSPRTNTRDLITPHPSGGRFQYLPFRHQHLRNHHYQARRPPASTAPPSNGIEIETGVDVEKSDLATIANTNATTVIGTTADENRIAVGGRRSDSKDFGTRNGTDVYLLSSSTPLASQPWGTVTTVTGSGLVSSNSNSTNTHTHTHSNFNAGGVVNVNGKAGNGRERTRSQSRTEAKPTTDKTLTTNISTHSYQVGLPIQKFDSNVV